MTATFTLRQNLDCTPEAAWHLLTDPDQMCRWSTAPITPISLGPQDRPDTAGALRMVTLPGGRIRLREVVEYAEFPRTFRYRVYDGGPLLVEHRGEQRVVETSEGVEVQWTVDMTLFPRPLSHLMAWQIRREVQRSLTEMESLARDLDTATLTSPDELPRRTAHNLDDLVSSALEIRVLQQEIADELAGADDPKQWFARVYQYVTETMIEAATGRLELGLTHPDWVLALIPVFHRLRRQPRRLPQRGCSRGRMAGRVVDVRDRRSGPAARAGRERTPRGSGRAHRRRPTACAGRASPGPIPRP